MQLHPIRLPSKSRVVKMATAMRQEEEAVAVARVLLPAVRLAVGSGSKQLEKRLNYLWQAAHACVASCSPAAHQMTCVFPLTPLVDARTWQLTRRLETAARPWCSARG